MTGFLKANYHTHTYRCQHAYGSEREYIEAAIRMGIAELGFSDHVPCPFKDGYVSGIRMTMEQAPEYVYAIRELGKEYASDIKLYVGFEAEYIPEFFKEQEKALIPDDLEIGETIKTPRGTFYVTAMSREQMEAAGYGLHHQSDDGKYLIMGNGTRAFAVPVQPENYLKAAEQTTEQNYNMIDGQINNTPTVAELEAKVKTGETISLVDLAEAVKADKERGKAAKTEKKPSIRAQLKAAKEQTPKKQAKQKTQDLERS